MGDGRRHRAFAKLIKSTFPDVVSVLCVADGRGKLANHLAKMKFLSTVIEGEGRPGKLHKNVSYQIGWFDRDSEIKQDLVVGMHPDEATAEIVLAAESQKKPWMIVPCCIKGAEAKDVRSFDSWIKKLCHLSKKEPRRNFLNIRGKNLVLWSHT